MIVIKTPDTQDAEDAWSYASDKNGESLSHKRIGTQEALAPIATATKLGAATSVPSHWGTGWKVQSVSLAWSSAIAYVLTVTYTRDETSDDGDSDGDDGGTATLPAESTSSSTQAMEMPITAASFWREAFLDNPTDAANAMKAVQAYINAEPGKEEQALEEAWEDASSEKNSYAIRKMIEKKLAGVEAFYYPAPMFTRTSYSYERPSPSGVGAQGSPGDGAPTGYKWLKTGDIITSSTDSNGKTYYAREETWLGATEWDDDLYGSGSSS